MSKAGGYEIRPINFSTGEIKPGKRSVVVATAGDVEQIRIDADGSVFVKGEKWGVVEIPAEVQP